MGQRAKELADRVDAFNNEVIEFVEKCTDEDWRKACAWEQWAVGVTARHIAAGHYSALGMARMMIKGEKLPELTMEKITDMANQHAREHGDCTKSEVLELLRKNGREAVDFVSGLDDSELDRIGFFAGIGKDVKVDRFIEMVILQGGAMHFDNMKAAVAK